MSTPQPTVPSQRRVFEGRVVSDRMDKTLLVTVERTKLHPKYQKRFRTSRTFKVHDEANAFHVGDWVRFVETRPLSRTKRWRVIGKVAATTRRPEPVEQKERES